MFLKSMQKHRNLYVTMSAEDFDASLTTVDKIKQSARNVQEHPFLECTATMVVLKCTNCNGPHNATYRGSPNLRQSNKLSYSVREGVSYHGIIQK
jgi:hypothetical protein